MANKLNKNPIKIDTFGGDVVISTVPMLINAVSFHSGLATDVFVIKDRDGDIAIELHPADILHFTQLGRLSNPPYTMYAADQTTSGSPIALIYL